MRSGVEVYGGFAGGEIALAQRDPARNATTIDGSKASGGQPAPHVVTMIGLTSATLDGFTVCGGNNASTSVDSGNGGGIYARNLDTGSTIANCVITGNRTPNTVGYGGGICLDAASPRIDHCTISLNTAYMGGGLACVNGASPRLTACTVHGNVATIGGGVSFYKGAQVLTSCTLSANDANSYGALYVLNAQTTLTACAVAGNTAVNYCGIYASASQVALGRCVVSGNQAPSNGPLSFYNGSNGTLNNTVIGGNRSNFGAAAETNNSRLAITQCTIDSNVTSAGQGVLALGGNTTSTLRGLIISRNAQGAINLRSPSSSVTVGNCLFFGNTVYDYKDIFNRTYTDPDSISLNLSNVARCIAGDPCFVTGTGGRWTAAAAYDAATKTTRLCDARAALIPGALRGRMINPDTSQALQALVLDNTTTTVLVAGNLAMVTHADDPWAIVDDHLQNGSPALDKLDPAQSLAEDFDGEARPGADGLADLGADEAPAAYTSSLVQAPPHSLVSIPANYSVKPVYSIPFRTTSALSGVRYVRLFYSHAGGPWTQYPDTATTITATTTTITFDCSRAAGDGNYGFYTLATDVNGVTEPMKYTPDDTLLFSTQKLSRTYVDKAARGLGTGASWADACTTISMGMTLVRMFGGSEVWVARGVYRESFYPINGTAFYGGFAGNETRLEDRNTTANLTVIDPRKSTTDTLSNHVLSISGVKSLRIDGFTLQGGLVSSTHGGAIYCTDSKGVVIANCTIAGNKVIRTYSTGGEGGGLYFYNSAALVDSCLITRNQGYFGGGVRCNQSTVTLNNCRISGNNAYQGGGLSVAPYLTQQPVAVTRCAIQANVTTSTGGGVYCDLSSPSAFANCLVTGNSASDGGGFLLNGASPAISQCTIANNATSSTRGNLGGGLSCLGNAAPTLVNTVVSDNMSCGIYSNQTNPTFKSCLIGQNTGTDLNTPGGGTGQSLVAGNPIWVAPSLTGTWSAAPAYDPQTNLTTLVSGTALGAPGSLAGVVITPNKTTQGQAMVMDNTTTTILVSGNWAARIKKGDSWQSADYHQGIGSPTIDAGCDSGEQADLDGNPRPVDIRFAGAERTGREFDLGACEAPHIYCTLSAKVASGAGLIGVSPDLPLYDYGSTVTLMAAAGANYHIGNWSGDVSTTQTASNPLVLTMNDNKSVKLNFAHDTGTIVISPNTNMATWSYTNTGGSWSGGMGSETWTINTGVITLTWRDVAGYDLPVPATTSQTLSKGGTVTFAGNYKVWSGILNISVVPPETGWSFRDSLGVTHSGIGNARLTDIPCGTFQLSWIAPGGYRAPSPGTVWTGVAKGTETRICEVLDPLTVPASPARHSFNKVLYYLLGQILDPTGLDLNSDSLINAADLVAAVNKLPPPAPANPSPIDGAVLGSTTVPLRWTACARAQSYNVYFWKSGATKGATPLASVSAPTYVPEAQLVAPGTRYYWQVEAVNGSEITAGPAWTFRTTSPMLK